MLDVTKQIQCRHALGFEQGCTHVRVVPMFLGVGKHVREDLPVMLQALRDAHPHVAFEPLAAVGEHPDLLDLMADIALDGFAKPAARS